MEPQNKEELQQFFGEFWNKLEKVERFKADADKSAKSANCRLVRGNVTLSCGFVTTERKFEEWCGVGLRMPIPKFTIATD